VTASLARELIEPARGDFVVVTAASSSVGLAAFQIARMGGATVIATTRTSAKKQALLEAGAHHVIATQEEDLAAGFMEITGSKGARVVFDPVGGPSFEPLTQSMARGGILLECGALSTEPTPFPLFTVLGKSLTLKGYLYTEVITDDALLQRARDFITDGLRSGHLKPVVAKVFKLDEIQEAHRYLESNEQIGKIVINV
jgi:NADPH:quinone reductase-like Zn-dependent oxidoreductase